MRRTVFIMAGAVLLVFVIALFAVSRVSMSTMLLNAETSYITERLTVAQGILDATADSARAMMRDVAVWNATVDYVQGRYPAYFAESWPDTSLLQVYNFNFIDIKDAQGNDVHVEFRDYHNDTPIAVPQGFSASLNGVAADVLAKHADSLSRLPGSGPPYIDGIFFYQNTAYYVISMPILSSADSPDPAGTVTFGTILNDTYFQHLLHYVNADFAVIDAPVSTPAGEIILTEGSASVSIPLYGIQGNEITLKLSEPRTIYHEGQRIIETTFFFFLLIAVGATAVLGAVIARTALSPIEKLSADLKNVSISGELDTEKYSKSGEFISLCSSINDVFERWRESTVSETALKAILNGMDAFLYVTNPDTDEILFINDKMCEHFGLNAAAVGQVCWRVLQQGFTGRCDFCPNYALAKDPSSVVEWEEHSTLTGRYYKNTDCLIDWMDKQKVHLQHSVDITPIKEAEFLLKRRLQQQELMTAMAQSFVSPVDVSILITNALTMSGGFLGATRIMLSRYDEGTSSLNAEYMWDAHEKTGAHLRYPFHPGEALFDMLYADNAPYLVAEDTAGQARLTGLARLGVCSLAAAPIHVSGSFFGALIVEDTQDARAWSESDIQLIKLIASVISGAIDRSVTEKELMRMSSIVDSSPQYVAYIDRSGRFEYVNQGAANITGYSVAELRDGGIGLSFNEKTRDEVLKTILPETLAGGRQARDLPITCSGGAEKVLTFNLFTTGAADGGLGIIAADITEKRRLEKDLIDAKEQADLSNQAKGTFLARMSHEMRTPMNAIIGMTSIAKASSDVERKEYCLGKIEDASKHLLGVINDILDVSKIEANKFDLSYTEFNFEKMLLRVTNVINFKVEEKEQSFAVKVDPSVPPFIVSDEQRLAQVITNLLSNATKFTPQRGSIALTIENIDETEGFLTLRISVSDTGIGIDGEQQSRLFRSFEQADGGISRKFGGTGLGLAICKSIVEMMGGSIWVESEEGQGATFLFTVKVQKGASGKQALLSPAVNWKTLRILVVDDSSDVREYFQSVAKSIDIACDVAESGTEACEKIESSKEKYNIFFIDWKMPGMDGVELARRIKERAQDDAVVIMISAAEWGDIEQEARSAGVDRFVPKPLFSSIIVDCINECLGVDAGMGAQEEIDLTGCFAGSHILLAEDVEINREIAIALLEETGVQIDCAENGEEALRMFAQDPDAYQMIFMDIHMPEVDGYEATRRIRAMQTPRAKTIPIVAMTANVFREDVEKCLATGMNDHVGKPLDMDEVIAKMRKYLPFTPGGAA